MGEKATQASQVRRSLINIINKIYLTSKALTLISDKGIINKGIFHI
jgi:hypothetical protein